MRPVSARAARRRRGPRKAPPPLWVRPLVNGAVLLGGMVFCVLAGGYLVTSGLLDRGMLAISAKAEQETLGWGLAVREIYAIGRQRTKSVDIRQKVEHIYDKNILMVDIAAIREDIESLPWVRSATVTRLLPATLIVNLEESRPMALWQHDEDINLIDEHGEVIPVVDLEPFVAMPIVSGPDAAAHMPELFDVILKEPKLARRVTAAQRIDGRRWNVFLDSQIEIRLPPGDVRPAWKLLAQAHARDAVLERAISAIDLRNPDWLVLRLMDEVIDGMGQPT